MSVIIRLQGLPWSANALDVRHFFQGLAIPEGGVHIVGGEQGDVFIAFSTDEDARRAMLMDGGRIIDSRVKLLLSSRSEMQKVIENARSKNLVMQGMMTQPVPMGVSSPSTPGGPMGGGVTGAAPGMASTTPNSATASVPHKEMQAMGMNASGAAVTTPGVQMAYVNRMMHPSMGVGQQQQQQMSPQYQPMQHQGMMDFQGPNKNSSMLGTGDMSGPAAGTVMHDQGMVGGLGDVSKKGGDRDRRDRDVGDRSRERDRDRDRDRERGRRRERSRSPRRRSRERDRERFRERDRDRRRSTSRGRTGDAMPDRGPREEPGAAFGDGPQGSLGELFAHDVDSRRGGDGGGMMSQFRMNEPSGNTVATTRPSFQAGRGGLMTPGDTGGAAGMPRMSSGSGRPLGASRWDTDDDRSSMQDKSQAVDRNPSRNFGGGSGGSPHQQDERPWDRDRRIGNADDTNFRSGPMQPQNDGMAFRGVCVAIQGAPFNVNPIQIRDFFAGLSIPIDGIRLPVDERGRRLLLAFVRFGNERDRDLALKRPGKQYLGNSPVDVVPCSDDDFLNASDASNSNNNNNNNNNNSNINNNSSSNSNFGNQGPMRPLLEPPSRPDKDFGEFCVLLKGLPFSCREGDVVRFFSEFNIRDVIVEYDQSGRASGAGFVEFANPMEAKRSLGLNGEKIGHRYIDISLTSKEHMESARCGLHGRGGVNRDNSNYGAPGPERGGSGPDGPFGGRFNDGPPRSSPMFRGGGDNNNFDRDDLVTDCAKVTGLPFHATDRDILNFFSAVEIVPIAIHMMLNSNGQPSGDAFCEFANPHDCKMALRQNGVPLYPGSRYFLSVKATPRREVEHTLGANASGPNQQGGHMRGDDMKPGLLGSPPGPVMGDNHPQFRPQQDSPHMQPPHFRQGNRHQGPQRPPGPDHHQGNPHRGGDMPVSPPPQNHPMNRPNRATVDTFGRPGCVVGAANVPYRSSVEDILDFFQGFGLTKDCVIRRFNEKGLPTGDARIAFHCPEDAQAAIRQLNKTPMYGRIITLHLV